MFRTAKPLFLICETPMHAGSGDDLGIVDLPIQRERHTSFPKIESSSLKGSIREAFETELVLKKVNGEQKNNLVKINVAFGYDKADLQNNIKTEALLKDVFVNDKNEAVTEFSGCLGFSDARLLLFPVKSMKGVFAWITCEKVLTQFKQDLELCKNDKGEPAFKDITDLLAITQDITDGECYASSDKVKIKGKECNHIILEEYAFKIADMDISPLAQKLQQKLQTVFPITDRLVVLSNNDFKDFVNLSTEVITRTKIDNNTGTVQSGALFTEEYLPSESVLYSLILASPEFGKKAKTFTNEIEVINFFQESIPTVFQIGGNATLGKGIVRVCKEFLK